ncbi:chromate transporter [Gracilibacillus ureilyticus]|uniref:Chromate transporter n=1 Tax=Gracilibacillus ureilyticus TaxID=531814 RepID=A0A1H9NG02_9BACI|nr:chromate transporter [Gracilibacillus ureilyticus]SER34880.1 chromate transporter [Gracilibacillus ureilyticus]
MINKRKILLQVFFSFFKISPITFGGGYAMIPMIEKEVIEKRKWMEMKDLSEIFALAQSVPGAIAVNSATFIGYRLGGVSGSLAALIGILIPNFIIVVLLSILFVLVKDNPAVAAAFTGIRPAIVALIVYAAYRIGRTAIYDKTTLIIGIVTVGLLLILKIHPVIIIFAGIGVGIIVVKIKNWLGIITNLEKKEEHTLLD